VRLRRDVCRLLHQSNFPRALDYPETLYLPFERVSFLGSERCCEEEVRRVRRGEG
jgi:hypothetical protein